MKKLFLIIIFISFIFSSEKTFANNWKIWDLFNFDFAIEVFDINTLSKIDKYYFKYNETKKVYSNFINYDNLVRKSIIKEFKNNNIDYYKTNQLIQNYNNFVYYTNELFYYFSMMENNKNILKDKEFQYAFSRIYQNSKNYYRDIQKDLKK